MGGHMQKFIRLGMLIVLFFLIGMMLTTFVYYGWYVADYQEIPITFKVTDGQVGILKDNSQLHFGYLRPGNVAKRWILVHVQEPLRMRVSFSPEVAPFMRVEHPNQLEPGVDYRINISAITNHDTPLGDYNGSAYVYFLRK